MVGPGSSGRTVRASLASGPPPPSARPLARYRFRTTFTTSASPEDAFRTIVAPELWLDAWSDALEVDRQQAGGPEGTGSVFTATVRGPAGYVLSAEVTTTESSAPHHAQMRLTGDLDGTATWTIRSTDVGTDVTLILDVEATRPWMRAASRVARPLFEWSHRIVVRHAVEAATQRIDARLLSFTSTAERPPD